MPSSTRSSPNALESRTISIMRGACPSSVGKDESPFAPACERCQRITDAKVDCHHAEENLECGERALHDLTRGVGELPSADHGRVGGLLDGGERRIEQRRYGKPHGLREYNMSEDPPPLHAKAAGSIDLPSGHRQNGATYGFGH